MLKLNIRVIETKIRPDIAYNNTVLFCTAKYLQIILH